ncbi:hypothetical protein SNEBB_005442 [Seison nebaliae]|nr:hypothetical protein SNEBB_005442 [Seison nebaliae]
MDILRGLWNSSNNDEEIGEFNPVFEVHDIPLMTNDDQKNLHDPVLLNEKGEKIDEFFEEVVEDFNQTTDDDNVKIKEDGRYYAHNFVEKLRIRIRFTVEHFAIRTLLALLIMVDVIIVITSVVIAFTNDSSLHGNRTHAELILDHISLVICVIFVIELSLRIFGNGWGLFRQRREIFDAIVILLTFAIVIVLNFRTIIQYESKSGRFIKLLVVGRGLRIFLIIRSFRLFFVKRRIHQSIRWLVSQNKRRFIKDGFDLDLVYITKRVIAMSIPAKGTMSFYRNSISEVAKFLDTRHYSSYRVYNLCRELSYDTEYFHGQTRRYLIDDHNVPTMREAVRFANSVRTFFEEDEKNVVAIHCKGGKGRTGTLVCITLLEMKYFSNAQKSLKYFGDRRTDTTVDLKFQGVETPSQSRYVHYFEMVKYQYQGKLPPPVDYQIDYIKIDGVTNLGPGDLSDFQLNIFQDGFYQFLSMSLDHPEIFVKELINDEDTIIIKNIPPLRIRGDVKFQFISSTKKIPVGYDKCAFYFWLYTTFIENLTFSLSRGELDNPHKIKSRKVYPDHFNVTLGFSAYSETRILNIETDEQLLSYLTFLIHIKLFIISIRQHLSSLLLDFLRKKKQERTKSGLAENNSIETIVTSF